MKRHHARVCTPRVQIEVGEVSASGALTYIHNRALPASVRRCVHIEGPRRIAGETADGTNRPIGRVKGTTEGEEREREREERSPEDEESAPEKEIYLFTLSLHNKI